MPTVPHHPFPNLKTTNALSPSKSNYKPQTNTHIISHKIKLCQWVVSNSWNVIVNHSENIIKGAKNSKKTARWSSVPLSMFTRPWSHLKNVPISRTIVEWISYSSATPTWWMRIGFPPVYFSSSTAYIFLNVLGQQLYELFWFCYRICLSLIRFLWTWTINEYKEEIIYGHSGRDDEDISWRGSRVQLKGFWWIDLMKKNPRNWYGNRLIEY